MNRSRVRQAPQRLVVGSVPFGPGTLWRPVAPIRSSALLSSPPTSRPRVRRFPPLPPIRGPRARPHRLRGGHHRLVVCRASGRCRVVRNRFDAGYASTCGAARSDRRSRGLRGTSTGCPDDCRGLGMWEKKRPHAHTPTLDPPILKAGLRGAGEGSSPPSSHIGNGRTSGLGIQSAFIPTEKRQRTPRTFLSTLGTFVPECSRAAGPPAARFVSH